MAAARKYSSEQRQEIKRLIDERYTAARISETINIPETTVLRIAKESGWTLNGIPRPPTPRATPRVLDVDHLWAWLLYGMPAR